MLQEYWCLPSMFSKWILTCTWKVLPITSNLGHSKLIFSSWSSVCVWSSSFHLWGLCSYLGKFPLRKWLLYSSEKWNRVLCICGPPKHLSSPSPATTAMSSSSRQTFWYITKATVATKGIILHMLWQRFCKGLTESYSLNHLPAHIM